MLHKRTHFAERTIRLQRIRTNAARVVIGTDYGFAGQIHIDITGGSALSRLLVDLAQLARITDNLERGDIAGFAFEIAR